MANLVMLELSIENVCQIAVTWEGAIINSRKPLKINVVLQLSGFTEHLPDEMTHLTFMPALPLKFPCSYELFCALILVIFRICLLISLVSGLDNGRV